MLEPKQDLKHNLMWDFNVLRVYVWLLAAVGLIGAAHNLPVLLAVVAAPTVIALVLLRRSIHGAGKVLVTLAFYLVLFFVTLVITALAEHELLGHDPETLIQLLVPGVLTALVCSVILRGIYRSGLKRLSVAEPKDDTTAQHSDTSASLPLHKGASGHPELPHQLTLHDPVVVHWHKWVLAQFEKPRSRVFATLAGAVRAIEMGKDDAGIEKAAKEAATSWAAPANVMLRDISDDVIEATEPLWISIKVVALSQFLAAAATYLRALEVGKDSTVAEQAARRAAVQWAPPKKPDTHHIADARVGGELRGIVYGYMRRTEQFPLGPDPIRRGRFRSMDKVVWTFGIQRTGLGTNGRPLSPIQVRLEGAEVSGALEDGDLVELPGNPVAATVNSYRQIRNLSKGTNIQAQPLADAREYKGYQWQRVMVPVIAFLVAGCILFAMFADFHQKSTSIQQMFPH